MSDTEPNYIAPALQRGLAILELFTPQRRVLTLSDMAKALGIGRASAFRLAFTLEHLGYLDRTGSDGKAYRLAPRAMQIGYHYLSGLDCAEVAIPFIDALRDATQISAHMGVRDGTEVVYVYRAHSHMTLSSNIAVGYRLPAHATAMGRILLSGLSDEAIAQLYTGVRLDRFSEATAVTLTSLIQQVATDRARGWTLNRSSFVSGIVAIAAPVRDHRGAVVAAINLSGPSAVMDTPSMLDHLTAKVVDTAAGISRQLGWTVRV
ncbi:IclR family transcriptional regulator [Azospirillum sp.]|uniref:IclR family transcriptional regulator n=1 Tax=Azospirillum sp. TaxID=34012 RepID=UPI003D757EB7